LGWKSSRRVPENETVSSVIGTSSMGQKKNSWKAWQREGKSPVWRVKHEWNGNIKLKNEEIWWEDLKWVPFYRKLGFLFHAQEGTLFFFLFDYLSTFLHSELFYFWQNEIYQAYNLFFIL
jgi:hypothetical protein